MLNGTVVLISYLNAPGVTQAHSVEGTIADIFKYLNESQQMRVKSTIPYIIFKMGFSAPEIPRKKSDQAGSFKADVTIQGEDWQTGSVPFAVSVSTFTDGCVLTSIHSVCILRMNVT